MITPRIDQAALVIPFNQPLPGMMTHNVFKREFSVPTDGIKETDIKNFKSRSRIHFEHARNNSLQSFLNYF